MTRNSKLMLVLIVLMLPFFPPHLLRWEFFAIFIGVPCVLLFLVALFVRITCGHWGDETAYRKAQAERVKIGKADVISAKKSQRGT